ncbi:MAG TPA: hypothetical protein VIV40_18260 [Kofleriaceae bacterium]
MKSAGEHARLARAFGVQKTRTKTVLITTGSAAVLGLASTPILVLAGGLAAGFGGLALGDRRAVRIGLRELDDWGFPIEGYRSWLLANEPTFEIELARDVDLDVLVTSTRSIDEKVSVSRTRERTFRFVTRQVALPPQHQAGQVVLVGDRELLKLLHAKLLAPLHADVGIQRMRMGDRQTLPAVPLLLAASSGEGSGGGMGAFRESAMAAPPALQALVYSGSDRELPLEARKLRHRAERVVYATGGTPHGFGTVLGITAAGAFTGAGWIQFLGPTGFVLGAVGGLIGGLVTAVKVNRRNARRAGESASGQGFAIEGYEEWLISGRPIFDVELIHPIDPSWLVTMLEALPKAYSVSVKAEVSWVEEVRWLDDRIVRIETRPTLVEPPSRIAPFYGGSHPMFTTFVQQVLAPLHHHAGIAAVRMGGYITRRV